MTSFWCSQPRWLSAVFSLLRARELNEIRRRKPWAESATRDEDRADVTVGGGGGIGNVSNWPNQDSASAPRRVSLDSPPYLRRPRRVGNCPEKRLFGAIQWLVAGDYTASLLYADQNCRIRVFEERFGAFWSATFSP